jgi:hypothetical protein
VRAALERRIKALEIRKDNGGRTVHFIKATDMADRDQQMAELQSSGRVGPRDGFLSLTGWSVSP